jgi:hypothetical protein
LCWLAGLERCYNALRRRFAAEKLAMKSTLTAGIVLALGLLLVLATAAVGQDRDRNRDERDRDDRSREDRGREDRGREGGRDFDPREIIRQADDNNDGMIEPSEVGQRSGYYIRRAAERAGLDASRPLPANQLLPALEAMRAENNGSNNSSSSPSSSTRPGAAPAATGFGAPAPTAAAGGVAGFNVPLTASAGAGLEKRFDQRVIDYVNDMIRERDANKNGVLEKTEWTGRWSTPPEESDTNKDNVLDKEELCVRIAKRFPSSSTPGSTSSSVSSGPPGGGSGPFGGPPGGGNGPFGGPPRSGGGDDDRDRYRRYAEGMIRQYDKNRDGKLDKDESSNMRSEHLAADVNKDGIITQDELQNRLQGYAGGSSGGSSSGESERRFGFGSRGSSSDNKTAAATPRRSFRITPATERLPKGMPDWFLRGDADGDGQVSMSEYTSTWTEQLAAELLKYDANGDGIITPAECQAVSGAKK